MVRRNLYDILQESEFDIKREYSRLYELFYENSPYDLSLYQIVKAHFIKFDRRLIGRCVSIDDYDETYGFYFMPMPNQFDIDYFLLFCEYAYNLCVQAHLFCNMREKEKIELLIENILECVDILNYKEIEKDAISFFVESKPEALAVAEIVDEELSFRVLEYNHHKLKGDLVNKKIILKMLADDIELKRGELNGINRDFTNQLFNLLNKFIRHNSSDNDAIFNMEDEKLEEIYDDIYQMWLLAKLQLDHLERKRRVEAILTAINH